MQHLDIEGPEANIISDTIRQYSQYSSVNIIRLTKNQYGTIYSVSVCGDNSNYCMNKGSNHRMSRIFFTVTSEGIKQRCFSWKAECKLASHFLGSLTPVAKHILFPP
jgi:hypothetical protein